MSARPPRRRMEPTGSVQLAEVGREVRTVPPEVARVRDAIRVLAHAYAESLVTYSTSAITVYANELEPVELEWLVAGIQPGTVEPYGETQWQFTGTVLGQLIRVYVRRGSRADVLARRVQSPVRAR